MGYYKRIFAKPSEYKGVVFRSHLEKDFAIWLDKNLIEWEYEKHRYELLPREEYIDPIDNKKHIMRSITILPDFYLPEYNLLIEIKGEPYDDRAFRLKTRLFKEKYPDTPIRVIKSREEFDEINMLLAEICIKKAAAPEKMEQIQGEKNIMEKWKDFEKVKKSGLTKQYLDNFYMADPLTQLISIFKLCGNSENLIFRTPLTHSCYLESQEVWQNLYQSTKQQADRQQNLGNNQVKEENNEWAQSELEK